MKNGKNPRIGAIYVIFTSFFVLVSVKIIYLQVFRSDFFQKLADNQYHRVVKLEAKRGNIYDRNGRILATDINCYSVFADPLLIDDAQIIAGVLSSCLGLSKEELAKKLLYKKRFVWIKRKISWEEKEYVKSLNLKGIGFLKEEKRFYPEVDLALPLLGIVDIDNNGLEGIEFFYNDYLRGKDGWVKILQDSSSRHVLISSQVIDPQKGADIVLSIDAQIQYWTENILRETIEKFSAASASAVIMDASTGQILALSNVVNSQAEGLASRYERNSAVCDMFEPGSVFKLITLIAAVDQERFDNTDIIFCENGRMKIPGTTLHDWRPYGNLSFKEVFMNSSNIGVAKIAEGLGPAVLYKYIKKLGFGRPSGIDFPGEVSGSIKEVKEWSKTSRYIIPIGQEVGVNLVQLVRAFAAVPNGGYIVKPHIVKSICTRGFCKEIIEEKKLVIPEATARMCRDILVEVVEKGTGKRAGVEGLKIGGKTGTAQKYDPSLGRYSPSKYRATFVGFVSGSAPPIVIGVTVDEPKKSHFGGVVAAPVISEVAKKVVPYLEGENLAISREN